MASSDASSPQQQRDFPFFLPLMFTFSVPGATVTTTAAAAPLRSVIINPFTQTMLVIPGDVPEAKLGQPPASKESIKAMESVVIGEGSGVGDQCVVCLEQWGAGDVARVMPCNHRFHGDCIEKWLGVQGSCPVCRHEMPLEEEEDAGKKREEEGQGRGGGVWVFSIDFGGIFGGVGGESNLGESGEAADFAAAAVSGQE